MTDPFEKQYKILITLNVVIFMTIIAFMVYFSPFGYFSLTTDSVTKMDTSRYSIITGLLLTTVIADLTFIKYHNTRHNKKK